jgi:hypothetical protein
MANSGVASGALALLLLPALYRKKVDLVPRSAIPQEFDYCLATRDSVNARWDAGAKKWQPHRGRRTILSALMAPVRRLHVPSVDGDKMKQDLPVMGSGDNRQ